MKRLIITALALACAISLVGCSDTADPGDNTVDGTIGGTVNDTVKPDNTNKPNNNVNNNAKPDDNTGSNVGGAVGDIVDGAGEAVGDIVNGVDDALTDGNAPENGSVGTDPNAADGTAKNRMARDARTIDAGNARNTLDRSAGNR